MIFNTFCADMKIYKNNDIILGPGLGDKIIFSSFPENYFKNTGEKLIDTNNYWTFDYNPYIIRNDIPTNTINLWNLGGEYDKSHILPSIAERTCNFFNFNTYIRHPRLYRYEDLPIKLNQIVVHLSGNVAGTAPDYIVNQILNNYKGCDLILIGNKDDTYFPGFINKLGLDIWDSIKLIAESILFIGINSSMMNAALCYPRVNKRIILTDTDEHYLKHIIPMDANNGHHHWLDHSLTLFNMTDNDLGVTYSYKKI
jgi:hypothetical protein